MQRNRIVYQDYDALVSKITKVSNQSFIFHSIFLNFYFLQGTLEDSGAFLWTGKEKANDNNTATASDLNTGKKSHVSITNLRKV